MERSQLIALLGTSDQPSTAEVRRARRLVARQLHPDAGADLNPDVMSQLNAACDEWINEIRAQRDRSNPPFAPEPTINRGMDPTAPTSLPASYAAATALLIVSIVAVVILFLGFSATSLAVGGLLGAGAGAVFAFVLYRMVQHGPRSR